MKRKIILLILFVLFLIPAGCATLPTTPGAMFSETTELALVAPERELLKMADAPADAKLAVAALVMEMRRKPGAVPQVTFDKAGSHRIADPVCDYTGFRWIHWDIDDYQVTASTGKKAVVRTTGGLHFADALGRAASVAYHLDYEAQPGKIRVTQSTIALVRPPFPLVKAYFVPLDALRKEGGKLKSFADFHAFATGNAVRMYATPEEIAAHQKSAQTSAWDKLKAGAQKTGVEGDWAALVFCMDRIPDDASLTVVVTPTESCRGKSLADPVYFDDAGWRIAVVAGHGRLHSDSDRFFVQALYQPAPNYWDKPVLAGRFGSVLAYSAPPEPAKGIGGIKAPARATEGPLAMGKVFLNLSVKKDAQLIQTRLTELGYYDSTVDGLFGKGSKASLQKFRKEALGTDSAKWDLDTQKALFKGSGL